MQREKIKKNKGFVLLYVVMISSIILVVTLSVGDISFKEIKFGTSAKDTNDAFFSADTGAECALYNDRSDINAFGEGGANVFCLDRSINLKGDSSDWYFTLSGLGNESKGCAIVKVHKENFVEPITTTIISKGYKDGGIIEDVCDQGPNTVERQLELNY